MAEWFALPALGMAALVFGLRIVDMTLDTLRVLFVMRGVRLLAWIFGFFQSAMFVIAITSVLSNLNNPFTVIGYAAGFATGNVLGMILEERLAVGFTHLNVISSRRGEALATRLRDQGFAVTELSGRGRDGMVSVLSVSVRRKQAAEVERVAQAVDPEAFITTEEVRAIRRGFWRS